MLDWLGPIADRLWYWVLVVVLVALGVAEALWPTRRATGSVGPRWFTNLGLQAVNSVLLLVLAPAAIVSSLLPAVTARWHPLTSFAGVAGDTAALLIGMLALDLYAYGMHRLQHRVFTLWRFHAVHHADEEMDVSTTLRHHPVEVLVSTIVGGAVFALLGIPEWVFPIYALIGIVASLVQHANAGAPGPLDRALQRIFVTPGMHQVHHSVAQADHDANYGTVLSVWDRLFGSYRAAPAAGPTALRFGVVPFTGPDYARPKWGLLLPWAIRRERVEAEPT